MMSSPIRFLWNLHTNRPRIYSNDISNFILIVLKRAVIQSRKFQRRKLTENYEEKLVLRHCDLDLWPKVNYFNRIRASAVSIHLAKTASKSVHHSVRLEFCSQEFPDTQTDRQTDKHTHRHTDKLQLKYNPSTILWRCKK